MSQHDINIANASGAIVRADINAALAALVGQNSGATAPTTTYPFMLWADTGTDTLWQRNAADSAWVDKGALSVALRVGLAAGNVQQVDQPPATIVRAATTALAGSLNCDISDTGVAIAAFNGTAGATYSIKFLGVGDIMHGAGLSILQTGATITTAAGDTAKVRMLTGTTCELFDYQRASGISLGGGLYKLTTETRDMTAASGSVSYTGAGFKPKKVTFYAGISDAISFSVGAACDSIGGITQGSVAKYKSSTMSYTVLSGGAMALLDDANATSLQGFAVTSFDADGITGTWTKSGLPTGIVTLKIIYER